MYVCCAKGLLCSHFLFNTYFQAKFLFMVRDGRATVHSIISRKVTITGFDLTSYRQCMQKWNHAIEVMHDQCKEIGKDRCMMVSNLNNRETQKICIKVTRYISFGCILLGFMQIIL